MSTLRATAPLSLRRGSSRRGTLIGILVVLGVWVIPASASAGGAPAWKLTVTSTPTNFIPGSTPQPSFPQYNIVATNVGSATTSGSATITDTLPAGLTPVAAQGTSGFAPAFHCGVAGQTVTCTGIEMPAVPAGRFVAVTIPVEVDIAAPPSLVNEASVSGGGAGEAVGRTTTTISSEPAPFGLISGSAGLSLAATAVDGAPATQAGSHPAQITIDNGLPTIFKNELPRAAEAIHDLDVHLPRGTIVNPTATPVLCKEVELETASCPDASTIGTMTLELSLGAFNIGSTPLYNMVRPAGVASEFGFEVFGYGIYVHIEGNTNTAGEYELFAGSHDVLALERNPLIGAQTVLWGNPSDESHDGMRGLCALNSDSSCPLTEHSDSPLLTMPSSCAASTSFSTSINSWREPGEQLSASALTEDSLGNPVGTDGCNQLDFSPTIESKPTTNLTDSPSGLDFTLNLPQEESFETLAEANMKDARVALPAGLSVNPSSADGQAVCTEAQFARHSPAPVSCPDAAKIGSAQIQTQLLDNPLPGAVYLAKPFANPFNSLLALYLAFYDPQSGVVIKLPGLVEADPQTGQLTSTFEENPELPFEELQLHLFKGPRAPLRTPPTCGTYSTTSVLTPWSSPEGLDATPSDSFATSVAAGGGPCPAAQSAQPNAPAFRAGTIAPQAGAYSPFVLKLSREDGSQPLGGIDTTLPKGLIGKLAGISYCPEPAIAQAQARSRPNEGAIEKARPSCPASSEVGSVDVAAGAGITPIHTEGRAYLAGPYKGAPLSLVVITPAIAGPFDLGAVVVRNALQVDPETAQVHAVSDPFPQILDGIPLDLRSVEVKLNRPNFILNPTSCDPMSITGSAPSALGSIAALSSPFQVGGCSSLGFKPKLTFALKGATRRTGHPALKATLTYPKGAYANIAKAQVTLPKSEFLDQAHIKTICTRVQFAAKSCPPGAIYGFARAITPLLDKPLEGPVYLRSSSHELPDLVAELSGQIDVVLDGRIDSVGRGIRTTFEAVPDAPVSKFTLEMKGGKKGLLINSANLCQKANRATVLFDGQNGKTSDSKPVVSNSCKGKAKKPAHKNKAHRR